MSRLRLCGTVFDVSFLERRKADIEALMSSGDFWSSGGGESLIRELSRIDGILAALRHIDAEFSELTVMVGLLEDYDDEDLRCEFFRRKSQLMSYIAHQRMIILLTGEYDYFPAVVSIHAGSGGLDAQDWAGMLFRMYSRFCASQNFSVAILDMLGDDSGGLKSVTFIVRGDGGVYGLLKSEQGIHRLIRISPFDSAHRRHTSFASVLVTPEISDDVDIDIRPEDLKVDTFRASGAGGQYVNRTDSAVRITHIPTGIVVTCQNERSQHMNRQTAMHVLRSRLYDIALRERQQELSSVVGEKKESTWGSQIRSYVLHPYTVVKDHRTGFHFSDVYSVLNGELSPLVFSYLSCSSRSSSALRG